MHELKDHAGRPMRFACIDVQLDYYVYVSRKWGKWSQSRLHHAAIAHSITEISMLLAQDEVPAERVFFDARFDQERIRRLCALKKWKTMLGDKALRGYTHPDGIYRIYDTPRPVDAFTGTLLQGETNSSVIETLFSKNSALDRLALLRAEDSTAPDGTPLWTAAADAPDWYYQQINAHFLKWVDTPDDGGNTPVATRKRIWMGQKEDHADDCEAMHIIAATMAGLTGAESMGAPAPEPPGPLLLKSLQNRGG